TRARDNLPNGPGLWRAPQAQETARFWHRYSVLERGTRFELATTCLEVRLSWVTYVIRIRSVSPVSRCSRALSARQRDYTSARSRLRKMRGPGSIGGC